MITLNNINLSSIDLSGIDLRGIKLGLGGRGGSGDGFPQLPGDVTRWHFGGLTNEMMAAMDNPRIEDADHKGRFLSFKNFAWKGMSGVGGYVGDFSGWNNNRDTTEIGITKSNSKVIIDVKVSQGSGKNIVFITKSNLGISNNVTIKITSTYPEGVMKFANSASNKYLKLPSNGIITLQDNPEYTRNEMYLHLASADLGQITIEQLPLYPGALVFDGVDDYGTCDNFPVLTKEKGYTVVALRSYLAESIGYLVYNGTNAKQSAFAFERSDSLDTWSWGKNSSIRNLLPKLMSYQTSNSYNNNIISTGTVIEGDKLIRIASVGGYSNVAIWELVFLDHDATEEELTKIKDYFVKTYPWLFPDQAWTVTGKTNEDKDRATIANITGNGNDLVLSNFGFIEGSGYNEEGEYAGYLVTDGVDDKIVSSAFKMGKDFTVVGEWKFLKEDVIKFAGFVKYDAFMFYNYSYYNRINIYIYSPQGVAFNNVDTIKAVTSEGQVYFDFNSIKEVKPGDLADKGYVMNIGHNGSNHTKLALKNFAIYPTVLSKDDCIKAYNYLQTLKAK